jgi:hypothetical protein
MPSSSTYHWKMYTNRIPVATKALNDFSADKSVLGAMGM